MAVFGKTTQEQKSAADRPETPKVLSGAYANGILRKPRITEKAYSMNAGNRYVFEVNDTASKPQTSSRIGYGVHVVQSRSVSRVVSAVSVGQWKKSGEKSDG
jgi:ribosomal protein L23